MGYTTNFQGEIKITPELTASQIKLIKSMEGDMRIWNPEEAERLNFTWFDIKLNEELNAIQWNGTEKFYDADKKVQYLIDKVIEKYPDIKFNGIWQAQGESFDDRWLLKVKNNKVIKEEIELKGKRITCPHCEEEFILEEK